MDLRAETAHEVDAGAAIAERRDVRNRWILATPALVIIFAATLGPLLIILVYSFLEKGTYGGVQPTLSFDAWFNVFLQRDIFDNTLGLADAHLSIFWRSVRLAFITTGLTLIVGFPTAYFIATRPERTRGLWLFLITIPFWTNLLIRTFAMMEILRNEGVLNSLLMLAGVIDKPIQILYTDYAITLGMLYVFLPLMVLPLYASMEKLDFNLVEAAYDLYADRVGALRYVIFPLVKPGVIAGSILVFIPSIGAYVTPRVLGGGTHMMLGNLIALMFGQGRNWPLGAALAITLTCIVLIALQLYVRYASKSDTNHG